MAAAVLSAPALDHMMSHRLANSTSTPNQCGVEAARPKVRPTPVSSRAQKTQSVANLISTRSRTTETAQPTVRTKIVLSKPTARQMAIPPISLPETVPISGAPPSPKRTTSPVMPGAPVKPRSPPRSLEASATVRGLNFQDSDPVSPLSLTATKPIGMEIDSTGFVMMAVSPVARTVCSCPPHAWNACQCGADNKLICHCRPEDGVVAITYNAKTKILAKAEPEAKRMALALKVPSNPGFNYRDFSGKALTYCSWHSGLPMDETDVSKRKTGFAISGRNTADDPVFAVWKYDSNPVHKREDGWLCYDTCHHEEDIVKQKRTADYDNFIRTVRWIETDSQTWGEYFNAIGNELHNYQVEEQTDKDLLTQRDLLGHLLKNETDERSPVYKLNKASDLLERTKATFDKHEAEQAERQAERQAIYDQEMGNTEAGKNVRLAPSSALIKATEAKLAAEKAFFKADEDLKKAKVRYDLLESRAVASTMKVVKAEAQLFAVVLKNFDLLSKQAESLDLASRYRAPHLSQVDLAKLEILSRYSRDFISRFSTMAAKIPTNVLQQVVAEKAD